MSSLENEVTNWQVPFYSCISEIGGGAVEACPAGFQADEKDIAAAVLKIIDPLLAFFDRRRTSEIQVAELLFVKIGADDCEVCSRSLIN